MYGVYGCLETLMRSKYITYKQKIKNKIGGIIFEAFLLYNEERSSWEENICVLVGI